MSDQIKISHITKRYGNVTVLDDVTIEIGAGELFGLIGPDGAGKSSLYRILATLSRPDSGSASIFGIDTVDGYRKIRRMIGYMPEQFSLYQDLTVMENLKFFASLFNVPLDDNYELIAPVFGQLARFPNRRAGALSGGMKQKLALSCALIHRPKILLLDEPTTGVDAVSRNEFWEILSNLRENGMTILVSTSYMDEATRCGRIAMINQGKILDTDTPENLTNRLGENLYNAVASDMFGLLSRLREMPDIVDSYTFGATIHVVGNADFDASKTAATIKSAGISDVKIYPAKGTIEDLFIKLTRNEPQR